MMITPKYIKTKLHVSKPQKTYMYTASTFFLDFSDYKSLDYFLRLEPPSLPFPLVMGDGACLADAPSLKWDKAP